MDILFTAKEPIMFLLICSILVSKILNSSHKTPLNLFSMTQYHQIST